MSSGNESTTVPVRSAPTVLRAGIREARKRGPISGRATAQDANDRIPDDHRYEAEPGISEARSGRVARAAQCEKREERGPRSVVKK